MAGMTPCSAFYYPKNVSEDLSEVDQYTYRRRSTNNAEITPAPGPSMVVYTYTNKEEAFTMTRLERRMQEAREGNEREVLEKYNREIARERERRNHSRNAFVRQCCDQQIARLTQEKNQIEASVIG